MPKYKPDANTYNFNLRNLLVITINTINYLFKKMKQGFERAKVILQRMLLS